MLTGQESEAVNAAIAEAVATAPTPLVWEKRLTDIFWVNSVAISHDGSRVVAGTFIHDYRQKGAKFLPNVHSRFGTYCFDRTSPKPLWSDEYIGWGGVFGVAVSADGTVAAASGWLNLEGETSQGMVRAFNTADGANLLNFSDIEDRVSWVALSADGQVLAAVADDVYVFLWDGLKFNPTPLKLGIERIPDNYVTSVALHPSGTWLAACDHVGHVYVATIQGGALGPPTVWTADEKIPFLSVAIAPATNTFLVGGGNYVFLFDRDGLQAGQGPIKYDTRLGEPPETIPPDKDDGRLQENVRWVAISADGTLLSTVANRVNKEDGKGTGQLIVLAVDQGEGALTPVWDHHLDRNPNSTSIDAEGQYVTVCDGYPTGKPAKFTLFKNDGTKLWDYGTHSMNWPMVISGDASAIAAGSDDGSVYYFRP